MSFAADEIAKIEHELDILRVRKKNFERGGRTLLYGFSFLSVCAFVALGIVIYSQELAAIFAVFTIVVCFIVFPWIAYFGTRPVDIVSHVGPLWPLRSEAKAIETMIAERERRLAEIKARQA